MAGIEDLIKRNALTPTQNKTEDWVTAKLQTFEGPESKEDGAYLKRLLKTFWERTAETDPVNLKTLKYFLKGKGKETSADKPVDLTHFWDVDDIKAMKRAMIRQNYTQEDWDKLADNPKDEMGFGGTNAAAQIKGVVGYDQHEPMTMDYLTSGYKYYANLWDDPAQRVQTTVGRIRPKRNKEGSWVLQDKYNFADHAAGSPDDPEANLTFGSDYLKLRTWMEKLTDTRPDLHFQITIPKEFDPTDPELKNQLLKEDLEYNARWREKYYNESFGGSFEDVDENFSISNEEGGRVGKQAGGLIMNYGDYGRNYK